MDNNFNYKRAAEAQGDYCEEHEIPMFAPTGGICPRCSRNIYLPTNGPRGMIYGYSVEYAENHHITGCPHCSYSFID